MPTDDDVRLTKLEEFSVEDWKDLYDTLRAFKLRVLKRHYGGKDEPETLRLTRQFRRRRPRPLRRTAPTQQ
jgi:hypothetical protein